MPIPPFNEHGLLPDTVHFATLDELRIRCVDEFPQSASRSQLFASLTRYRNDLAALGLSATQWIDGSFVDRSRPDPTDIDIVNFCESEIIVGLSERALTLLKNIAVTWNEYRLHTFLVIEFPYDHSYSGKFEQERKYWRNLFSQAMTYIDGRKLRAPSRGRKGIVQITLGDAKFCPRIDPSL